MDYSSVSQRHFYRCLACLDVFAVDGPQLIGNSFSQRAECDCGGKIEHMGRVGVGSLVREEERCACDARCTNAKGPHCDCKCQGQNHGTQRVVKVIVKVGAIPKLEERKDLAERLKVREEARVAFAEAFERIDHVTGGAASKARKGEFIQDKSLWWKQQVLRLQLKKAANLKTHKGRLAAMSKVCAGEAVPA